MKRTFAVWALYAATSMSLVGAERAVSVAPRRAGATRAAENRTGHASCCAPSGKASSRSPELRVIHPRQGEIFSDTPIVVQVAVARFTLTPPIPYFGKANPRPVGHLHVTLDDFPLVATASTRLMFAKRTDSSFLKIGKHTLSVELVHDNHEPLSPPVRKRVEFIVVHHGKPWQCNP